MSKLPYFPFYPLDWLRDTGGLSPMAKAAWIDILAYAWNEPNRGVYERSREAFCSQLRIDQGDLFSILGELATVADLTASNKIITVKSRRMINNEKHYESNRIRQRRHYYNTKPNANLTNQTLDVRSQQLLTTNVLSPSVGFPPGATKTEAGKAGQAPRQTPPAATGAPSPLGGSAPTRENPQDTGPKSTAHLADIPADFWGEPPIGGDSMTPEEMREIRLRNLGRRP